MDNGRKMRTTLGLSCLLAMTLGACDAPPAPSATSGAPAPTHSATPAPSAKKAAELAVLKGEAKRLASAYGAALKTALMGGMAKGPTAAVGTCHEAAPGIAEIIDGADGWSVRRTSLKLRNPDNAPDPWERAQLEDFETKKAAGTPPAELVSATIVEEGGKREFRFMKAIPTAALCLSCHGPSIGEDVEKELARLYPNDQARGFSAGDLRGAFTLRKKL
jgi:Protein of unknown function (DUF3365)